LPLRIQEVDEFKKGERYVKDKPPYKFIRECKQYDLLGKKIKGNELLQKNFEEFLDKTIKRNGRKIEKGSFFYKKMLTKLIGIYLKMFFKILINVILNGDRFIFFRYAFAMTIVEMDVNRNTRFLKYKYYHRLKGVYPVIRIALHPGILFAKSKTMKTAHVAFTLESYMDEELSKMVTYKIAKEGRRFSKNWETVIKFKK